MLEEDAEIMTNTQLEELLADEPPEVQEEILRDQHRVGPSRCRWRCSCRSSPGSSAS